MKTYNIALEFTDTDKNGDRFSRGYRVTYDICTSKWRKQEFSLFTKVDGQSRFVFHKSYPEWDDAVAAAEKLEAADLNHLSEIFKFNPHA